MGAGRSGGGCCGGGDDPDGNAAHVWRGLLRIWPSSRTMPTPILLALPSMPRHTSILWRRGSREVPGECAQTGQLSGGQTRVFCAFCVAASMAAARRRRRRRTTQCYPVLHPQFHASVHTCPTASAGRTTLRSMCKCSAPPPLLQHARGSSGLRRIARVAGVLLPLLKGHALVLHEPQARLLCLQNLQLLIKESLKRGLGAPASDKTLSMSRARKRAPSWPAIAPPPRTTHFSGWRSTGASPRESRSSAASTLRASTTFSSLQQRKGLHVSATAPLGLCPALPQCTRRLHLLRLSTSTAAAYASSDTARLLSARCCSASCCISCCSRSRPRASWLAVTCSRGRGRGVVLVLVFFGGECAPRSVAANALAGAHLGRCWLLLASCCQRRLLLGCQALGLGFLFRCLLALPLQLLALGVALGLVRSKWGRTP